MCDDDFTDLRCFLRGCRIRRYEHLILYVGNIHALLIPLMKALEKHGCLVSYTPSGWAADMLLKSNVYYSLVLFDDGGMDSIKLTRTLKHRQKTPIIMLSATDMTKDALAIGVNEVLEKPENVEPLI